MRTQTLKQALNKFVKASPWLTDEDAPALTMLRLIAEQIDAGKGNASLFGQYGQAYRALVARAPKGPAEDRDELDDIIPD